MALRLNRRHFLGTAATSGAIAVMPRRAGATTPFTMQAAWINDAEFAGYFDGVDEGYYAEEGLALTYLPGGRDRRCLPGHGAASLAQCPAQHRSAVAGAGTTDSEGGRSYSGHDRAWGFERLRECPAG